MESLVRTRVDRFRLEDSLTLAQLEALRDAGRVEEAVLPVDRVFVGLPGLRMRPEGLGDRLVHNGNPFRPEQARVWELPAGGEPDDGSISQEFLKKFPRVRVYDSGMDFIGIYEYREAKERYQPFKIFPGGS